MKVNLNLCESCLEKQRTIDRLKQENQSLREKVHRLERKAEQQRSKPGGAQPGHPGHGRKAVQDSGAERIETIPVGPACPRCGKTVQARAPEVLPKSLYGNQLITQVVFLHYRQGIPMGRLCDQLGIGLGGVSASSGAARR